MAKSDSIRPGLECRAVPPGSGQSSGALEHSVPQGFQGLRCFLARIAAGKRLANALTTVSNEIGHDEPLLILDAALKDQGGALKTRWGNEKDVWLHGFWVRDWADRRIPLGKVDAATRTVRSTRTAREYPTTGS